MITPAANESHNDPKIVLNRVSKGGNLSTEEKINPAIVYLLLLPTTPADSNQQYSSSCKMG